MRNFLLTEQSRGFSDRLCPMNSVGHQECELRIAHYELL